MSKEFEAIRTQLLRRGVTPQTIKDALLWSRNLLPPYTVQQTPKNSDPPS